MGDEGDGGKRIAGFGVRPLGEYIFVAEFGQPNCTRGGIYLGDHDFSVYRHDLWRYGEVLAVGPGKKIGRERIPMPDLNPGDVVMYSRKHGTRIGMRYHHPQHPDDRGLLIRVLDPDKVTAVVPDFEPWWDIQKVQPSSPNEMMSG